jgi:hypothetical protein
MTIWDYYWQTGDIAPLKENLCRVDSILEYFDRHEVRTKEGLLLHDIRLWYFGDWSTLYKGKGVVPSFLNMWCLYTMENLLEMYRIAGLRDRIPELEKKTARLRALVKEKLYSPKRKIMLNGLNPQGEQDSGFSVHDQVLAIMLNLVPEAETTMLEKIILPFIRMEEQDCAKPSLFWTTYVFEVLREKGYGAEVINYIKKKWKPMIPTGTTWEHYNWEPGAGGSSSHAWTAHPSYHFVNIISGITQMAPLWKKIKLSPCFIEGVHNAECVIPAPPGQIKSAWSEGAPGCFDVNIELPEGVSCEVDLERIKQTVKGPGQFSFKA